MKTFLTDNWIRCWKAHQLSYLLHCVAFNVSLLPHHRHNITVTTQHNIIPLSIPIANDDMSALLIGINSTKRNVIWRRKKFFQRWNSLPRSLLLSNEGKLNTAIRILLFENDIRIRYDILPQWMRPSIYFSQLFPIYMYVCTLNSLFFLFCWRGCFTKAPFPHYYCSPCAILLLANTEFSSYLLLF